MRMRCAHPVPRQNSPVTYHAMPWAFILHPGATQTSGLLACYFKTVRFARQAHRATLDAFHAAENGPNLVDGELQAQKKIQCPTTSAHWLHKWERGWCHWRHGRAPKFKPCSCFLSEFLKDWYFRVGSPTKMLSARGLWHSSQTDWFGTRSPSRQVGPLLLHKHAWMCRLQRIWFFWPGGHARKIETMQRATA